MTPLRHLAAACLLMAVMGCGTLPSVADRPAVQALPPAPQGPLAEAAMHSVPSPGASAFRLLVSGRESLQARMALIQRAQRSIDLQVYQFKADDTGLRVVRALRDAAARGVRVRLLLDDLYTAGDDALWLGLAAHPNVDVRLFNPFTAARDSHFGRLLLAAFGEDRLHRRMHNKLFVADGVLAVAGGRNIGDAYFLRDDEEGFLDLDLLCAGAVVPQMAAAFDEYWNSVHSHDVRSIADDGRRADERRVALDARLAQLVPQPAQRAAPQEALSGELSRGRFEMVSAPAVVAYDLPAKIESDAPTSRDLVDLAMAGSQVRLLVGRAIRGVERELMVVSPYLIPGPMGVQTLGTFTARGVRVKLLTNSLAATDERLVHIGYRQYRTGVLRAGVELYELSPLHGGRVLRELARGGQVLRLHAKCALIDRRQLYMGSMNFDPRSRELNTEFGLLIDSPELAAQVGALVDDVIRRAAWRLRVADDGSGLRWSLANGGGTEHDEEPDTDLGSRLLLDLLAPLVPEELL